MIPHSAFRTPHFQEQPSIRARVERIRRRFQRATLLGGACGWLAVCLALWLVVCVLDNLLHLPAGLRLPLAAGGLLLSGGLLWQRVLRPARRPPRPERIAVLLERRFAIPDNGLINAFQFEGRRLTPAEQPFAARIVAHSQDAVSGLHLDDFLDGRRVRRWLLGALLGCACWALYAVAFPRQAANAFARLTQPLGDVPPVGTYRLRVSPADDLTIVENTPLQVDVHVSATAAASPPPAAPTLIWRERAERIEPTANGHQQTVMQPTGEGAYTWVFPDVRRPFVFRVLLADSYSPAIRVRVRPLPQLTRSLFTIGPPAYTGLGPTNQPGPPAALRCLPGSSVKVSLETQPALIAALWRAADHTQAFAAGRQSLEAELRVADAGVYTIESDATGAGPAVTLAKGNIVLETDRAPTVDWQTPVLNQLAAPGAALALGIQADDDFGLSNLVVTLATPDTADAARPLKTWTYLGPPGPRGPVKETWTVTLHPPLFQPGETYVLTAVAHDFRPDGAAGRSRPMLVRVKALADLTPPAGAGLDAAFAALKRAIEAQEKANGATENIALHFAEAQARDTLASHQKTMLDRQTHARREGRLAVTEFNACAEGAPYTGKLATLVEDEMGWVLHDLGKLTRALATDNATPPGRDPSMHSGPTGDGVTPRRSDPAVSPTNNPPALLSAIADRQSYILAALLKLLGRLADEKSRAAPSATPAANDQPPPTAGEAARNLKDDLEEFAREQKRVIAQTRQVSDRKPEDLTEEEQQILGALAREEAQWAAFFKDKLTDFSKLPQQDFSDPSLAKELNEVVQDVELAADALYDKAKELAVPREQSGLENAEELMHNLERWLANKPDKIQWNMEEPAGQADIALAELPAELEDIVGALLDKEEAMTEDVEDVSSSWLDSLDKGAGWDAADGPISSMSAKGVTGNQLPNQQEIGGRSGEGRTGRSHGQMVEDAAVGKDGRQTPTRLTPSPFEPGSIKDSSSKDTGGATGGGKQAGFTTEGLRGPVPPPLQQQMARLAGQQAAIRQEAEALALKLRAYRLPSGDLENAARAMQQVEALARQGNGAGLRQAYSRALDSLHDAGRQVRVETGLSREHNRLPDRVREEVVAGLEDGIPKGYEEMVGAYFRALAESAPAGQ